MWYFNLIPIASFCSMSSITFRGMDTMSFFAKLIQNSVVRCAATVFAHAQVCPLARPFTAKAKQIINA